MNQVEIVNRALIHLGQTRLISSIDEAHDNARVAKALWDGSARTALAAADWPWATRRRALTPAPSGYTAPTEWGYAYAWPSDCLRPVGIVDAVYRETPDDQRIPFRVERDPDHGRLILTTQAEAVLRYVWPVTNPDLWSPGFQTAFAYHLAADMSGAFRSDRGRHRDLVALWQQSMADALAVDLSQAEDGEEPDSSIIRARG